MVSSREGFEHKQSQKNNKQNKKQYMQQHSFVGRGERGGPLHQQAKQLADWVAGVFWRAFDIAPAERRHVAVIFGTRALLSAASVMGLTMCLGVFLLRFGAGALEWFFVAMSGLTIVGAVLFSPMVARTDGRSPAMLFGVMGAAIFAFSVLPVGGSFSEELRMMAAFFGISIFLAQAHIGALIWEERVFSPLSGVRVFPVIESAEAAGGLLAGGFVVLLADILTPAHLALLAAMFASAAVLCASVGQDRVRAALSRLSRLRADSRNALRGAAPGVVSWGLRHCTRGRGVLLPLAGIVVALFCALRLVEFGFIFAVGARAHLEAHPFAALLHEFGVAFFAVFSAVFLAQLLIGGRVWRRLGVSKTLGVFPAVALFAALPFAFGGTALGVAMARGSAEVGAGLSRSALLAAVYSVRQKNREMAKEFLEGFAKPVGVALAVLSLVALGLVFGAVPLPFVAAGIAACGVVGGACALAFSRAYHRSARDMLLGAASSGTEKLDALEMFTSLQDGPVDTLIQALEAEQDSHLRVRMIDAIGRRGSPRAVGALMDILRQHPSTACAASTKEAAQLRLAAVRACTHLQFSSDDDFASEALSRHVLSVQMRQILAEKSTTPAEKSAAARTLAHLRDASVVPLLFGLLQSKDATMRAEGAAVLEEFPDPAAGQQLAQLVQDPSAKVRGVAIGVMWHVVPAAREQLFSKMLDLFEVGSTAGTLAGLSALRRMRLRSEAPRVAALLASEVPQVQLHSLLTLVHLGEHRHIPRLARHIMAHQLPPSHVHEHLHSMPEEPRRLLSGLLRGHVEGMIGGLFSGKSSQKTSAKTLSQMQRLLDIAGDDRESWMANQAPQSLQEEGR